MAVYDETRKQLDLLPRDQYMEEYRERGKKIWSHANIPTVGDIAGAVVDGEYNENMRYMFDFFDNEEKFMSQAKRTHSNYSEEESEEYIASVISSNVSDIADAGYLYKQMMASQDDLRIIDDDCGSHGVEIPLFGYCHEMYSETCEHEECVRCQDMEAIKAMPRKKYDVIMPEVVYQFRVRGHWVNEYDGLMLLNYDQFTAWVKKNSLDTLTVRTPGSCKHASKRTFCSKCCGHIPNSTKNIGAFATLCITEFATQAALSSMNRGSSDNINMILAAAYDGPEKPSWNDILEWCDRICDRLEGDLVSKRFYEVSLLSRAHEVHTGEWRVFSLKTSMNHTNNKFGAWLFQHNRTNFKKMVQEGEFDDNSLKLQIALNEYER